mgnify:CR=1 FL=1
MAALCKCGGTLIMRNHQFWIGYFCPSCKQGGSIQKRKKKWAQYLKRNGQKRTVPISEPKKITYLPSRGKSTNVIKTSMVTYNASKHLFIADQAELDHMKIKPLNDEYLIHNTTTNQTRSFILYGQNVSADGELNYTEYIENTHRILLRVYND